MSRGASGINRMPNQSMSRIWWSDSLGNKGYQKVIKLCEYPNYATRGIVLLLCVEMSSCMCGCYYFLILNFSYTHNYLRHLLCKKKRSYIGLLHNLVLLVLQKNMARFGFFLQRLFSFLKKILFIDNFSHLC